MGLIGRRVRRILRAGGRVLAPCGAGPLQELGHLLRGQFVHSRGKRAPRAAHLTPGNELIDGLRHFLPVGGAAHDQPLATEHVAGREDPATRCLVGVAIHVDPAPSGWKPPGLDLLLVHGAARQQHRIELAAQSVQCPLVTDGSVPAGVHAQSQNLGDLRIKDVKGELVNGRLAPQPSSGARLLVKQDTGVTHSRR